MHDANLCLMRKDVKNIARGLFFVEVNVLDLKFAYSKKSH